MCTVWLHAALALDTHRFVKELKAAGFTEPQAEAVTTMMRETREVDLSALATKADVLQLRTEQKADLAEAKADIVKWVVGAIGFQTLVMAGAVAALARLLAG